MSGADRTNCTQDMREAIISSIASDGLCYNHMSGASIQMRSVFQILDYNGTLVTLGEREWIEKIILTN